MDCAVLVVAAGRGTRAGTGTPKQYATLGGMSVLERSVRALLSSASVDACLVAIHRDDRAAYDAAVARLDDPRLLPPVTGGENRQASVLSGLEALEPLAPRHVLIHDAARPFPSVELVERVLTATREAGAAFAALPLVDTIWRETDGRADSLVARDGLWRAQTPQGFRFDLILARAPGECRGGHRRCRHCPRGGPCGNAGARRRQ